MLEHAEKLEAVMMKLAGVETLLDGLIQTSIEQSPALMVINGEIDRAFMEVEAVAEWMKSNAEGVE